MKGSHALTRRLLLCSLLGLQSLTWAAEGPEALLSETKRELFGYQYSRNKHESDKLENSWINPVVVGYSDSKSDQFGYKQHSRVFSVTADQPVFKSGGIWYAIKYANATREYNGLSIKSNERAMIKQVVSALFNFRKIDYSITKQELLVENDRLDIERKREQYMAGELDSSFLDQAILGKNRDTLSLYELQEQMADLEESFANLSSADPRHVELPTFALMEEKRFVDNHVDLAAQRALVRQKDYYNTMTWAKYLVTLSLQGGYYKPYQNDTFFTPGGSFSPTTPYTTYGFTISMPFDIGSYDEIQSTRADYLREKLAVTDQRYEVRNRYRTVLKKLQILEKKIALSREDERLYTDLTEATREQVEAGEKTSHDYEIMNNSRKIRQLDAKIYAIDRQLILLDLYEKSYAALQ